MEQVVNVSEQQKQLELLKKIILKKQGIMCL